MTTTPETAAPQTVPQVTIASYPTYRAAEQAVDLLSDSGFPVAGVSIVGKGVSTVETVTRRLTKGRAAVSGLAGGLWTGLFVGLLLGIFVPGIVWFSVVLTSLAFGAVFGALMGFVGHALTGGRRDFESVPALRAEVYEVVVDAVRADAAVAVLAGTGARD